MLVGLSGYARSGKDTVASILVYDHGFTRVAFADVLKDCLLALNPIVETWADGNVDDHWAEYDRVKDIIDIFGWDKAKERYPELRELLQRLGTEVGRSILGENIWVDAAMSKVLDFGRVRGDFVFSDARFLNEARAITPHGEVWRVNRSGVGPANDHISEVGLDDWPFDRIIANNGTLEDLSDVVAQNIAVARKIHHL